MFRKLIEKMYLKQKENLLFYDKYMDTKTEFYYKEVGIEKYKDFTGKIFFVDINLDNDIYSDEYIRDKLRQFLYKRSIVDVFRIRGDKFIVLTGLDFNDAFINTIEDISYGFIEKTKKSDLEESVNQAVKYSMIRKYRINSKKQKQNKSHKKGK